MNKYDKKFDEKLLEAEKPNLSYKEKYEREVKKMVEQKLTGSKKLQIIAFMVLSIVLGIFFGTIAIILPKNFPIWGRLGFGIGSLFSISFFVMYLAILKKGSINQKKDNMSLAWTGWGFVIIIGTIALVFSPKLSNPIVGVHWLVSCLFYLIASGVFLLRAFIERSELKTREKLLEIELHLAELSEKIESKNHS